MDIKDIIDKFLSELNSIILDYNGEIEHIKSNNMDYNLANEILETLRNSPVDFAVTFFNLSDEVKERVRTLLEKSCSGESEVNNIINETLNLYSLNNHHLLENSLFEPQKTTAIETLEELERVLSSFIEDKKHISEEEIEHRNKMMEKLNNIGTLFGNGEQYDIINDVKTLEEVLNLVNLSDEEKIALIKSVIENNIEFYEERINERNIMIQEEIEKNKKNVEEKIENSYEEPPKEISIEQINEIERILSQKDVIERIVRIIADDVNNIINIENPTSEESEIIEEALELARENMIDRVKNNGATPEESLQLLYDEYDQTKEMKNKMLHEVLDGTELVDTPYNEQIEMINKGIEFYRKNKKSIQNLTKQEREIISKYMVTIYKTKEHRKMLYQSKSHDDTLKVTAEAAYEIQVLLGLMDSLEKDSEEYKEMILAASRRISDILESVEELKTKVIDTPKEETKNEGKLYYLMRNDNKSMFENDIRPDDLSKGISPEYYKDILEALDEIRQRSNNDGQISVTPGYNYNYLRKNNIQITNTSGRIQILFIPINKTDSIIVGIMFTYGKRTEYKEQDDRIRRYQQQLDELKDDIINENEETKKMAKKTDERIKESLSPDQKKSSLKNMFDEGNQSSSGTGKKR